MRGSFVVCEGLDRAGKTTSIMHAMDSFQEEGIRTAYVKGLKTGGLMGRISRRFPSTLTLLSELAYQDLRLVRPALHEGNLVFMDRWHYTVLSHNPPNATNDLLEHAFVPCLTKPDLLVYFTVSLEERLERIERSPPDPGHDFLLKNTAILVERIGRLYARFLAFPGEKAVLDTTGKSEEESGQKLHSLVSAYLTSKASGNRETQDSLGRNI